jgi:hypothetical protein
MALTLLISNQPLPAVIAFVSAAWLIGTVALAVYRLFLSPLANFPGPKLAALSRWYEAYYEIICRGRYSRKIDELHNKYGITRLPVIPFHSA